LIRIAGVMAAEPQQAPLPQRKTAGAGPWQTGNAMLRRNGSSSFLLLIVCCVGIVADRAESKPYKGAELYATSKNQILYGK